MNESSTTIECHINATSQLEASYIEASLRNILGVPLPLELIPLQSSWAGSGFRYSPTNRTNPLQPVPIFIGRLKQATQSQARALFVEVDPLLWQLRHNTNFKGQQVLPDSVKQNLLEAATLIESVTTQLSSPREDLIKQPSRDVYGLTALSKTLRSLADGANDGYGYDLDMVHQYWVRTTLGIIGLGKADIK